MKYNSEFKPWPNDKPLYKYLKKEYAERFMEYGEIHIGTLFDFRKLEGQDKARGDKGEGTKEITEHIPSLLIEDPSKDNPLSDFAKSFINVTGKNNQFINCTFTRVHDSKDLYIYCLSSIFDERPFEEFNCGTCIRVNNPHAFISEITKTIRTQAQFLCLSQCEYTDRIQKYGDHDFFNEAIIKSSCFRNQDEVRVIWKPRSYPIKPFNKQIKMRFIRKYCEVIKNEHAPHNSPLN